jgi:tRNA(Ile)-lysidine synthase
MPQNMYSKFIKYIGENDLVKPHNMVLLAVSGGIDSMVMTHMFNRLGIPTGIAHCNFSLRGEESDSDEEMVRKYAEEHKIPFFSIRFKTLDFATENGLSVQMAARELRYKWFEEIRIKNVFDSIAVAHNLNDNIETILLNLVRGTGIAGMTGIKPFNERIIRPLLFATRYEIIEYCNKHHIVFREDKSNSDTKYTRNKIRHLVIPVLKEINPSIETTLNETALRFAGINEIVSDYISALKNTISKQKGELITFDISLLKTHFKNPTILYELFKHFGISSAQVEDLCKVIEGKTGGVLLTHSHTLLKNREEFIVSPRGSSDEEICHIKNITGLKKNPVIASAGYINITTNFKVPTDSLTACIDSDKISFPIIIRKWKPGDFFYPLGMKQKKKLSDYFIDNKFSGFDKEKVFVLESDGKIVWIIGNRIDDRFKITGSTIRVLVLKCFARRSL